MANVLPNKRKQKKLVTQSQIKKAFEVATFKQLCHDLGYDPGLFLIARRKEMEERIAELEDIVANGDYARGLSRGDVEEQLAGEKKDAMAIDLKIMEFVHPKQRAMDADVKSAGEPIRLIIEG